MLRSGTILDRSASRTPRRRAVRPLTEVLEDRLLLYSSLGDKWAFNSRITYSFMPDGTSIGGYPSALFQTLNANYPTWNWQQQIEQAATLWENVTNVNLARVSDGGQAVGGPGNQQDDPRFGDIRIGAMPMAAGVLGMTFLPPPANGGTDAGDIMLNSNINWRINSNYDLMTVVAHEFGHSLGLGDQTTDSTAEMYYSYGGIKQMLGSDDVAGIQSIYGTRPFDLFNQGGTRDNTYSHATNINTYIDGNAQIAIPSLDITTPGDSEWFYANVPSTTNWTMTVTVQSSNLSSLSPSLAVYDSSLNLVGQASWRNSMGGTVYLTTGVQPGQGYYYKVLAAGGPGAIGGYGLLVNFGSQPQSPIQPPNTVVPSQPDQGGGWLNQLTAAGVPSGQGGSFVGGLTSVQGISSSVRNLTGWVEAMNVSSPLSGPFAWSASPQAGDPAVPSDVRTVSNALVPAPDEMSSSILRSSRTVLTQAQAIATPVAAEPAPAVLQALDEALVQWNSNRDRTALLNLQIY